MYEAYWNLQQKPFESAFDSSSYYPCELHQGALLKLRYAVESRHGCAVLAGAPGLGKTMLIHALRRQLAETFHPFVHLVYPQMPPEDLLTYIADALGAPPAPQTRVGTSAAVGRIERFIQTNSTERRHAVIVVDEAHLLEGSRCLETMRLLLNFEGAEGNGLTVILVGQPPLLPALDRMPQLEERMAVKCLLRPLSLEETVSYVNHRLRAAQADSEQAEEIFTPEALEKLYELTHGIPRQINRLCDLALLVGFAEEQSAIGPLDIDSVCRELITVAVD